MLVRRILIASLAIQLIGCASPTASSKKAESKPVIEIERLVTRETLPAWIAYGTGLRDAAERGKPRDSFAVELEAREAAAQVWLRSKEETNNRRDGYLDSLLMVEKAGYLREYVWTNFRTPAWGAPPEGLKLEEFREWRAEHLRGHRPQTLAALKLARPEKPLSAWTHDAKTDIYTHYYSGYCFPPKVGPFGRGEQHDFDPNGRDVSVAYNAPGLAAVTVYVYPFSSPVSEATDSLAAEFKRRKEEIALAHPGAVLLAERQRTITVQGRTRPAAEALFEFTDQFAGRRQVLHSRLVLCVDGDNFFKVRATYLQAAETQAAEALGAFFANFHRP